MNQTATRSRRSAETPGPTPEQQHDEPGSRGPGLLAALRWLGRELSGLVRWVAKRVAEQLPAPLRWLGGLFAPGRKRGFGFWWLVTTLGIAVALGMVVAVLVTPVAGIIALPVVAIATLVRRRKGDERDQGTPPPPARGAHEPFGTPGRTGGEAPAAAAAA